MIVVTGHIIVDPDQRNRYLELSGPAVLAARRMPGCLEFSVAPDVADPARVNIVERWESRAVLEGFRSDGPQGELGSLIEDVQVAEYELADPAPNSSAGTEAARGIQALVQDRVAAVVAKDVEAIAKTLAEEVESFNVLPPHRVLGREAVLETTRAWFAGYRSPIGYTVRDLQVTGCHESGFASYLYQVTGTLQDGVEVDMWVRATLGCVRRDGRWIVTHDHESVPWNPQTGQAVLTLTQLSP